MLYQLPTHPSLTSNDPLGLVDVEEPLQADVLSTLIDSAIARLSAGDSPAVTLPTLIEDIAYTIHGNGSLDTACLRTFLSRRKVPLGAFLTLLRVAYGMQDYFPGQQIDTLDKMDSNASLKGPQVDCLLAHQFLGTLRAPQNTDWGLPNFTPWFKSDPAHPRAIDGYLTTILDHFAQGGYSSETTFTFELHSADQMPDPAACDESANVHLHLVQEESEPSNRDGMQFVLVAAHPQPGPGPSATQEERLQASSPALSVSALLTPVIPDNAAVVTSAFPVHAAWRGHNRTARLEKLLPPEQRPERGYILADALPLDEIQEEEHVLKDLLHGRVQREVRKLYAAFYGAQQMAKYRIGSSQESCVIESGAWGCGAFGGNILVKVICMLIAAGLTGVKVHLNMLEQRDTDIRHIRSLLDQRWTAAQLWNVVRNCTTSVDLFRKLKI